LVSTATRPVLTDSKTFSEVVNCLTEHIPIKTQGKCEQQNIFEILIRAATQRDSIESGTCSFYAYATVYVIKKNKRVTLAIKAVQQQNTLVAIITYLLALIEPLNRIKTTIKNPTIRFLFVALSFLIINIWIYLIWNYLSRLKRSSRQVFSHLFTLKQMLEFLPQAIDRIYGVACEVCLPSG
jgi:putative transposase